MSYNRSCLYVILTVHNVKTLYHETVQYASTTILFTFLSRNIISEEANQAEE
jgi:hypothetical protein